MLGRNVLLVLVTVGALAGVAAGARADDRAEDRARRRTPVVEVFEKSRDAVVSISSTEIVTVRSRSPFDSFFDDLFDMPARSRARQQLVQSVGSGFVIHPDGYVVTNAHVIARTTERKVIFADGRTYEAQIVAADASRDLAVLKIEAEGPLPTLPLGRSDDLMVGETVIAIGNPLGYQHTVTAGVVSAVDRAIEISRDLTYHGLIQTDASINPGNSGGPLLNALGELIGVNTAIRGDAQNIGFAIPVDQLRAVLPELLDVERRYRIRTGLVIDSLDQPRVKSVRHDSPADRAGIREGDVLVAINGRPVREGIDLDIALINRHPDELIALTLDRAGRRYEADVRLGERPAPDGASLARTRLGLDVRPLGGPAGGTTRTAGLLVEQIEPGGPADVAGIEPNDVLLAVGRRYVGSLDELGDLLDELKTGDVVSVRLLRVERRRKLQLEGPIRIR